MYILQQVYNVCFYVHVYLAKGIVVFDTFGRFLQKSVEVHNYTQRIRSTYIDTQDSCRAHWEV